MEHEERISAMEVAQGISKPNYQRKIDPSIATTKFQMETYTCAIEKMFAEIIINYHGKTLIPPMNVGEELER